MQIKLTVFGKPMSVLRKGNKGQLFSEADKGIRRRVYDVVIPAELKETELPSGILFSGLDQQRA
jgi:hypothetical protein